MPRGELGCNRAAGGTGQEGGGAGPVLHVKFRPVRPACGGGLQLAVRRRVGPPEQHKSVGFAAQHQRRALPLTQNLTHVPRAEFPPRLRYSFYQDRTFAGQRRPARQRP